MWKDFLYLNKKDKIAYASFTILVVVLQISIWTNDKWMPYVRRVFSINTSVKDSSIVNLAEKYLPEDGSGYPGRQDENKQKHGNYSKVSLQPFEFDPNKIDSLSMVKMGIRPYVIKNMLNYRRKGGVFRKTDDFARIYGLDEDVYNKLLPYIKIDFSQKYSDQVYNNAGSQNNVYAETGKRDFSENFNVKNQTNIKNSEGRLPSKIISSEQKGINSSEFVDYKDEVKDTNPVSFELNSTDTFSLKLLKGIGSATASRIMRYGKQLGGYYDFSQLTEIRGVYPEAIESIRKSMTIDKSLIKKININTSSLEVLKSHPYIDFYQAKVIIELRKVRKGIKDIKDLSGFREFKPEDIEKLKWYIEI
jgi:DNA uptake protein ComE-like DNA-binding protein